MPKRSEAFRVGDGIDAAAAVKSPPTRRDFAALNPRRPPHRGGGDSQFGWPVSPVKLSSSSVKPRLSASSSAAKLVISIWPSPKNETS